MEEHGLAIGKSSIAVYFLLVDVKFSEGKCFMAVNQKTWLNFGYIMGVDNEKMSSQSTTNKLQPTIRHIDIYSAKDGDLDLTIPGIHIQVG